MSRTLFFCLCTLALLSGTQAQAQVYPKVSRSVAERDLPCFITDANGTTRDLTSLCNLSATSEDNTSNSSRSQTNPGNPNSTTTPSNGSSTPDLNSVPPVQPEVGGNSR